MLSLLYQDLEAFSFQLYSINADMEEHRKICICLESDGMLCVKINSTSPSSGAQITGSFGVTTAPSPIIPSAKPSSGAVERSAAIPVTGL